MSTEDNYSNLGLRHRSAPLPQSFKNSETTSVLELIEFHSEKGWQSFSEANLLKSLCQDFKLLLQNENLKDLASHLIQLDHQIHALQKEVDFLEGLDSFYKNLSTLFIRMALEEEVNETSMKRSIEIALEEEIHAWEGRLQ